MSAVTDITSIVRVDCPQALRDIPGWLIWRFEPNENPGGKPRKVPYYAAGGRRDGEQGGNADREQLATFDAARAAAARRGFDGVGFATLPDFDIVALDFDDCVVDGQVHPEVLALLDCTYAELSPSKQGIRAFFKGQLGNRKSHYLRNKERVHPFGFETFSSRGYVTFTGDVLDIVDLMGNADEVAPVSPAVMDLIARRFKRDLQVDTEGVHNDDAVGLTPSEVTRALAAIDPSGLPYEDTDGPSWMGVGMALHHETGGSADGFEQWDAWASASDKYTSRDYGTERWRSMGRYTGGASITARSLVKWANELGADIALGGPASAEDFEAVEPPSAEQQAKKPMRFQVVPAAEFAARPPPQWIVKGVVPQAELMVIYGESTAGKTFVALDLAGAIARGVPWRGRKTKQRRVVYVCAEGQGGFQMRLRGYAQGQGIAVSEVPMGVIADAPNLLLKDDALDVCKALKAFGGTDIIVMDTFAQMTPGANENAGEDMGKALAHCKRISRALGGALVILVHHSGKDASKGARGWSGLKAAADAEMEVTRGPGGRAVRLSKSKDGEDNLAWGFDLEVVPVAMDEDDEPITSCFVVDATLPSARVLRPLGAVEQLVNGVVQEMAKVQSVGIEVKAVLDEAVALMPEPTDGKRDTRRMRARRALESLCNGDDAPYYLADDATLEVV